MERITTPKIEYICFTSHTGYAFAARNYILALSPKYDVRVAPLDRGISPAITQKYLSTLLDLEKKPEEANALQILHCIPNMFRRIKTRKKRLAFATIEASKAPEDWIKKLNDCDGIIVPSQFCKEVFSILEKPIYYIPHCLDYSQYNLNVEKKHTYDKFTFLFFGTWKERKGWKTLIQAWKEVFASDPNVQLVIKTHDEALAKSGIRHIIKSIPPNILFDNGLLKDEELPSFFKSFNCLVAPTMGEGFGLPGLQSLSVGVPIITTAYSGVLEYANENNALLLVPEGTRRMSNPLDGYMQFANQEWPFISVSQLAKQMLKAYNKSMVIESDAWGLLARRFGYESTREKFERIKL